MKPPVRAFGLGAFALAGLFTALATSTAPRPAAAVGAPAAAEPAPPALAPAAAVPASTPGAPVARAAASPAPAGDADRVDDDARLAARYADDPVGSAFPGLGGQRPARQLETLRWMQRLPPERVAAAMHPYELDGISDREERAWLAKSTLDRLVASLEARGHRAPALGADFVAARVVDAPPGERPPAGD